MPRFGVVLLARRFLAGRRGGGRGRLIGAVAGVALSMVPLVVVQQVADGMIAGIAERFIETGSYHLQAVARTVPDPGAVDATVARLERIPGVVSAVPERRGFGLLYADAGRTGVSIRAVPSRWWDADPRVRELIEVSDGAFDLDGETAIVLGTEVARRLGVAAGDEVRLLTVRPVGDSGMLPRVSRFTVAGVMSTGYRDLDRLWVFIPLVRGRRVIPDESATELVGIKVIDAAALPNPLFDRGLAGIGRRDEARAMLDVAERVLAGFGPEWFVTDWYAAEEGRYITFLTSRNLLTLVMAMIVLVAMINISSALVLLVVEKEQEIAILRATGVSAGAIATAFVAAAGLIGLAGAVLGLVTGLAVAVNINGVLQAIETGLSALAGRSVSVIDPEFYLQRIPVDLELLPAVGAVSLVLALSLLAAAIPARRASRVRPDRILRRQTAWSRSRDVIH